jgi:hypothetical protein
MTPTSLFMAITAERTTSVVIQQDTRYQEPIMPENTETKRASDGINAKGTLK